MTGLWLRLRLWLVQRASRAHRRACAPCMLTKVLGLPADFCCPQGFAIYMRGHQIVAPGCQCHLTVMRAAEARAN